MTTRALLAVGLCVAIALVSWSNSPAQIPQKMNYQVMLTDDADQPLANESVQLVFRIYDVDAGGGSLWTETHNVTTSSIGVVSVVLGSTNPISIDMNGPRWLQVEVDGQVLSPRREIVAAAYALHDETGGAGDGHSLDAVDGSPADVVYVDGSGEVGVGTTTPEALLHVNGQLRLGSSTTHGGLAFYAAGTGPPTISMGADYGGAGGAIGLHSAVSGLPIVSIIPDLNTGGGGSLTVARNAAGDVGFEVNGNLGGSEQPVVAIAGSSNQVVFNMSELGDDSVELPLGAVNSGEIFDEARVASSQHSSGLAIATSPSKTNIRSSSIYCPDDGYVLALATATATTPHTYGSSNSCSFFITDVYNTFSGAQSQTPTFLYDLPTETYTEVINCHGLFPVTGGASHWFYFQGTEGYGQWMVWDYQLTLVYIPSAGGTVDTDPGWDKATSTDPKEIVQSRFLHSGSSKQTVLEPGTDVAAEIAALRSRLDELEARTGAPTR